MKFTPQQIESIKQKSCVDFLLSRGYKPKSTLGRTVKYLAPWRTESTPSVHVYKSSNTFIDYGDRDKRGSVINLCMEIDNIGFKEACNVLLYGEIREHTPLPERQSEEPAIKILYVKEIESPWLIQYLSKRCINLDVARKYCKQVRIELVGRNNEPYQKTCVGFPSDKGGWEFRSGRAKISNSPKYLTTINPGKKNCFVFEGYFDFLTFCTVYGHPQDDTVIVLNSASFVAYCDFSVFNNVWYFGDRDSSGDKVLAAIQEKCQVKDFRNLYKPYKDYNAWWVAKNTQVNNALRKEML